MSSSPRPAQAHERPVVFIVDDDKAVRSGLQWMLESTGLIVRTYNSAEDFLAGFEPDRPGCLVLDVRLPGMTGLELQRHLNRLAAVIPVIVITGHADVETAVRALKTGAVEFIEKPLDEDDLLSRINAAISLDARNRRVADSRRAVHHRMSLLSDREHEVLDGIVTGKLNKQIAMELGLSPKTIEVHRARVMQKMKVKSLAELVKLVTAADLATPPNGEPPPAPRGRGPKKKKP